ncbi:MAG: hypothetical protein CM15mP45_11650 [Deltaproteobacteria bacterium]|nr:MAG: hypothetical protein CM15mP45_11650 [Deltaproteobacteria bacterium]
MLITAINILGGLLVGVTQYSMSAGDAFDSYATLTIGDGLVSQIPALIISVAAGIAVTKASSESKLSIDLQTQIFSNVQALYVVAAVLLPLLSFRSSGSSIHVACDCDFLSGTSIKTQ